MTNPSTNLVKKIELPNVSDTSPPAAIGPRTLEGIEALIRGKSDPYHDAGYDAGTVMTAVNEGERFDQFTRMLGKAGTDTFNPGMLKMIEEIGGIASSSPGFQARLNEDLLVESAERLKAAGVDEKVLKDAGVSSENLTLGLATWAHLSAEFDTIIELGPNSPATRAAVEAYNADRRLLPAPGGPS